MQCPTCQASIRDAAKFCPRCGQQLATPLQTQVIPRAELDAAPSSPYAPGGASASRWDAAKPATRPLGSDPFDVPDAPPLQQHRAPEMPASPAPTATPSLLPKSLVAVIVGGMLVLLGPALPWVQAGSLMEFGVQHVSGVLILLLGAALVGLAAAHHKQKAPWALPLLPLVALLALALALLDLLNLRDYLRDARPGIGLLVVLLGGLIVLGGAGEIIARRIQE